MDRSNYGVRGTAQLAILSKRELQLLEEYAVLAKDYILAHKLAQLQSGDQFIANGERHDSLDHAVRFAANLHTYLYSCEDS